MYILRVDRTVLTEAQNIVEGIYAPLTGFVREQDFNSICSEMRTTSGKIWAMPIILDITTEQKKEIDSSSEILITDGEAAFQLKNLEIYTPDKVKAVAAVFGTSDSEHPGVARYLKMGEHFLGGTLVAVDDQPFLRRDKHHKSPEETREIFRKNGWTNIVAFQTRNPPHRSHEYLQKAALGEVDGLLIQPVIGPKKSGDIEDDYIIGSYDILIDQYYKSGEVELSTFHTYMRYAGPREAVFHAQVRKNFGCTHMIIGRDHAGVGDYYGPYDAHKIFDQFNAGELGIQVFKYNNISYCNQCEEMIPQGECEHDMKDMSHLSGTEFRRRLQNGEDVPDTFMRPEIFEYLSKQKDLFS